MEKINGSHTDPLLHYQKAARIYCGKADLNPDLPVPVPHPMGLDVPYAIPQWRLVAEDLLDLSMKLVSMKEAAAMPSLILEAGNA